MYQLSHRVVRLWLYQAVLSIARHEAELIEARFRVAVHRSCAIRKDVA
jgi:hypothetical protein